LTVISHDLENDPDMIAMIGASAALTISGIPFMGPIGGARVCYKDGEYLINPPMADVSETDLDLVVAGTKEGVLMVESEAQELSEAVMLGAVKAGHEAYQSVIDGIIDEPLGAAHRAPVQTFDNVRIALEKGLNDLSKFDGKTLKKRRQDKFLKMGKKGLA